MVSRGRDCKTACPGEGAHEFMVCSGTAGQDAAKQLRAAPQYSEAVGETWLRLQLQSDLHPAPTSPKRGGGCTAGMACSASQHGEVNTRVANTAAAQGRQYPDCQRTVFADHATSPPRCGTATMRTTLIHCPDRVIGSKRHGGCHTRTRSCL